MLVLTNFITNNLWSLFRIKKHNLFRVMTKRLLLICLQFLLTSIHAQQRIPMQLESSGIYTIPCEVNGLKLRFVFDTGAADVHLSLVEAAFMLKNGYLSDKDVIGSKAYRTASGDIVAGTVVNLKKITIGELELENVHASVVKGQTAPLLLGQSALSRIGKIEIDNLRQAIRITYPTVK